MTCHDCREKLLRTLDPSAPSAEVAAHVAQCAACRQYQQQLARIESHVPRIPVPASRGPEACKNVLRQLSATEPIATAPAPGKSRRPQWIIAAVAASVLIAAVGIYWSMNGDERQTPIAEQPSAPKKAEQTLVAQLLDCDLSLAEGASGRERVKTLAVMNNLIQDAMASKPGKGPLQALAKLQLDTLLAGLLPLAKRLPLAEREATLPPVIEDLVRFHDEEVAVVAPGDPVHDKIAEDLHDIHKQLQNLLPAAVSQIKDQGQRRPRNTVTVDWQRDLPLIEAMVTIGRKLALEENPLKRAQQAHELAEKMGGEIQRAAQTGDGVRAAEYGHYVNALLSHAVANNVTLAQKIEQAPAREDLDRFAKSVSRSSKAIEADLKKAGTKNASGIDAAVKAVSSGRMKVENSVQDKYRPSSDKK